MRLMHLGLAVRDARRSQRFYAAYFGFDPATARRYPDGTVIVRDADGFDLALHEHPDPGPPPAFFHIGFRVRDPDRVRAELRRMRDDGLDILESYDEPAYVAFTCADPDGYPVETYWEPEPGTGPSPRRELTEAVRAERDGR